jgi:hypothetical protein
MTVYSCKTNHFFRACIHILLRSKGNAGGCQLVRLTGANRVASGDDYVRRDAVNLATTKGT